ncbi:MAG: flagellar biosynthetic protein FliR [Spirochaetes bacterium]|nr:flagellar biosynthetic protein FliR [Spirochaetota bacterium]
MFLETLAQNTQLYLLIFVRIFALLSFAPITSSTAIPAMARAALALFTSVAIFPMVYESGYVIPEAGLMYAALIIGEVGIGIITGFLLQLIHAVFFMVGQFFSLQIGFSAAMVFDPVEQEEIPIIGQFFNYFAMLIFLTTNGFYKLFHAGVFRSFQSVNAYTFLSQREHLYTMILTSIGMLFQQALIISIPILGSLFLVSVSMGLLAKAAPQMNLLMMGFPLAIALAFFIILMLVPFLVSAFSILIDENFSRVLGWLHLYWEAQ